VEEPADVQIVTAFVESRAKGEAQSGICCKGAELNFELLVP
jgi:hypothetical protein